MACNGQKGLEPFTANGLPVLSDGTITSSLAAVDNLWIHAKVYSEGGENALHEHPSEDHAFFVLQGRATFMDVDEHEIVLGAYDGIMIPKGTLYRFQSGSQENLVMLRVGAAQRTDSETDSNADYPSPMVVRLGRDGLPQPGDSPENRTASRSPVQVPGQWFGH